MDLELRPIRPDDASFLYRVYASTRAEELAQTGWDDAQKESFLRMQFAAQHQDYLSRFAQARFDMIERDGQPIGRLYVDRRPEEIRIIDIALLPEHRIGGVGSRLLQDLLEEAMAVGVPVRIHVEQLNPARQLYQRLGFVTLREEGVYRLMEWSPGARAQAKMSS